LAEWFPLNPQKVGKITQIGISPRKTEEKEFDSPEKTTTKRSDAN
jgi:hypothetical protein